MLNPAESRTAGIFQPYFLDASLACLCPLLGVIKSEAKVSAALLLIRPPRLSPPQADDGRQDSGIILAENHARLQSTNEKKPCGSAYGLLS